MSKKKNNPCAALRKRALSFPGAWEDAPWGDSVVKVGKKIFAFLGETTLTLKLTEAHAAAMSVPNAKPTAYGLVAPKKLSAQLG